MGVVGNMSIDEPEEGRSRNTPRERFSSNWFFISRFYSDIRLLPSTENSRTPSPRSVRSQPSPDPPPYERNSSAVHVSVFGSPNRTLVSVPLDVSYRDGRRRLNIARGTKEADVCNIQEVVDFKQHWDPDGEVEISPSHSVSSRTDIRLVTSFQDLVNRIREELKIDNHENRRLDWAWTSRCQIGKRAIEDLVLTKMAKALGRKDHRDYKHSYKGLVELYMSGGRPNINLTKADLTHLGDSDTRNQVRDLIHPKLEDTAKVEELFAEVLEFIEENENSNLMMYKRFHNFVKGDLSAVAF
jgi:hypothetical protein